MGQAKSRGSFEERKAAAIERDNKIAAERHRLMLEEEAAKTPEKRAIDSHNKILLASLMAMGDMMRIRKIIP